MSTAAYSISCSLLNPATAATAAASFQSCDPDFKRVFPCHTAATASSPTTTCGSSVAFVQVQSMFQCLDPRPCCYQSTVCRLKPF